MTDISPYVVDAMLTEFATIANSGSAVTNATLTLYTTPAPSSTIDTPAAAQILAVVLLPDPAVIGPSDQKLIMQLSGLSTSVIIDGRASWARFRNKDNITLADFTIGLVGSETDINLEIIDLLVADILNLNDISLSFSCP